MQVLIIVNHPPYGDEKAYNAFRLAMALQREHGVEVKIFLLADSVFCALKGQKTPEGYYNIEKIAKAVIQKGGQIKACGSCMDARGISEDRLIDGVEKSTMKQLALWTYQSDKVLTF